MAETLPGAFETNMIAPLFVGGIPLDELTKALDENKRLIAAQKASAEEQFWSSPRRANTDTTREVYEVALNSTKLVNALSLDLARFPHQAHFFYRDTKSGAWKPLLGANKKPLVSSITDSVPSVITPPAPGATGHPQHYGAGHWVRREYAVAPVSARQFRVVLVRQKSGKAPVDRSKRPVTYSLGVRGLEIGYKVKGRNDIPVTRRDPVVVTERESFASTTDILGSPVSISVRENRASDLLRGAMWKSEPQPIPNAVVNLYVDARDGLGQAQVVDRFYLDPVTSGVSMNVYYSNDVPDQVDFAASDNPLDFPLSRTGGRVVPTAEGLVFPDEVGYIDIDNAALQFNQTRPFWLAMTVVPDFEATESTPHIFLDTGTLLVTWNGGEIGATLNGHTVTYAPNPTSVDTDDDGVEDTTTTPVFFVPGQEVPFAVGFDGSTLTLTVDGQTRSVAVRSVTVAKAPKTATGMASFVRIGGLVTGDDQDPGHGRFRLASLILKAEAPPENYQPYFEDQAGYVDGQDTSNNALLRYLPGYQTPGTGSVNPLGLIGGVGNRYEDLVWTPINRDYRLAKGYVVFNPVAARYFKFEFTNLAAQPYDDYTPTTRKVKVFPTAQVYRGAVSASNNTASGGATAAQNAASTLFFADQARLYTNLRPLQPETTYAPTAAVHSTDTAVAARLRERSIYHNLQQWHAQRFVPRFVDVQKHAYETVEVRHTQRVAYFAGLNRIEMSRLDYATSDDTEQYLEPFADAANLVVDEAGLPVGGWRIDEGWLATPDSMGVEQTVTATSKVFASRRKITGLQFATQQTPPVQILPDPDLDDPVLRHWRGFGDAQVTPSEEFTSDIGSMVRVQRDSTANFWSTIEDRYASWDAIEEGGLTWDDLESSDEGASPVGGLASAATVAVSQQGRLYAAARVYATESLSAPLYVQIVGEDGAVLAEEPLEVKAGQVAEWYAAHTIGEGGEVGERTWDDVEDLTWDDLEAMGTWDQVAQTSSGYVGKVGARVVQVEPTADSWYVDNLSLFDDAIVWEFSRDGGKTFYPAYDVRNDPHGTFVFPPTADENAGLGLVWRVVGTRPGQRVDSLAIRPWYDSLPMGQPYRETIQAGGPNTALVDHYPPITDDPRWKVWNEPIPEDWYFVFRQWLLQQRDQVEKTVETVVPNTIVPVDEGMPPEPNPHRVVGQTVLFTSTAESYTDPADGVLKMWPTAEDYYPFGPTATAVLDDGTYFVAVHMFPNYLNASDPLYNEPGFIRMWHLAPDLSVLGTHDQPWGVDLSGNPRPFAMQVEGNTVHLVVEAPVQGVGETTVYGDSLNRMFDTGAAYDATKPPADPSLLMYGTGTGVNTWSAALGYLQIGSTNTTAMVATNLRTVAIPAGEEIKKVWLRVYYHVSVADLDGARWKIADRRLAYGSDVIASGTGMAGAIVSATYLAGWNSKDIPLNLTSSQVAALTSALATGDAVLAFDPAGEGTRRVSGMLLYIKHGPVTP